MNSYFILGFQSEAIKSIYKMAINVCLSSKKTKKQQQQQNTRDKVPEVEETHFNAHCVTSCVEITAVCQPH